MNLIQKVFFTKGFPWFAIIEMNMGNGWDSKIVQIIKK